MASDAMYTPLLAHPDITPHDNDNDHPCKGAAYDVVPRGRKIVSERLLCTLVLMACALSIISSVATMSLVAFKDVPPAGGEHLQYASTYIGLDSVFRNPAAIPPRPLRGFPVVVGIVNRLQPTTSYPDTPSWESTFGTVYTADRAIRMSSAETTIVQFWAGDYGMERCSLEFTLPASATAETVFIQAWRVDAPQRLSPGALTWTSRPKKNGLLISQEVKVNGTVRSEEFHCHSGSFQAFELGCAGDRCLVDFRQDSKLEAGAWLIQRSSM
ncbi:hypothetical protein VTO73DRAFT_9375 [Trametes versicolor]